MIEKILKSKFISTWLAKYNYKIVRIEIVWWHIDGRESKYSCCHQVEKYENGAEWCNMCED